MDKGFQNTPPRNWNEIVGYAGQSVEYANAMNGLGYKPYYYQKGNETALIQIRGGQFPIIRRLTSRAYLFPSTKSRVLIEELINKVGRMGIPFVKIGNNNWGIENKELLDVCNSRPIRRHTFLVDLSQDEEEMWRKMHKKTRNAIRKAEKEGVTVREIADRDLLPHFYRPYRVVSERVRKFHSYTIFPLSVFQRFFDSSRESGFARFFVADWNGQIIAGDMVICFGDSMLAYQGGMLREHSALQAPSALVWHCIRRGKAEGFRYYDMGGCTPGLDRSDSRYSVYAFKKRFAGELVQFYNAEVALNEKIWEFQEGYLSQLWDRLHPYLVK